MMREYLSIEDEKKIAAAKEVEFQKSLAKAKAMVAKRLAASAAKAAAEPVVLQPEEELKPAQQMQLPFYGDYEIHLRSVPNSVLRSALFGAIQRGKRAYQDGVKKASVDGVLIVHSGPQLDQADLDVWLQCLDLARMQGVGKRIQFSAKGFLESIDRSTGGKDIAWLKSAFRRLSTSVVEIQDGKRGYFGPMLMGGAWDDESGRFVIEMNPPIVTLFGDNGSSGVDKEERKLLRRQPLAQWLHGFYLTHAHPYPYKAETLHKLCGSEAKLMKNFKVELKEALVKVEAATGWICEIDSNNLVRVTKREKQRSLGRK